MTTAASTRFSGAFSWVAPTAAMVCWGVAACGSLLQAAEPAGPAAKGAVPVKIVEGGEGGFTLLRGEKPYFVRGVGGNGSLELLAKLGGNSVRTWGLEGLEKTLDEAHAKGITVAVGVWLGHKRHGFDYANADQVADQMQTVREAVFKFKDHPAVLLWGLGNEMEGYEKGDDASIWSAVNNLAAMVKKIDPNHPTMTVVAEIGGDRVKNIHRLCPEIDVVGINSYGGAATIPTRYRAAGGEKPYLLTEFGPPGMWETTKNRFGAAPELTSTEKGDRYRKTYEGAVSGEKALCLGSYAFLWGHKQEATATWFGIILPDGRRLAAADVLQEMWTQKPPVDLCPRIESLKLVGSDEVAGGAVLKAELVADDPEKQPIEVKWVLQAEAESFSVGGDAEAAPPAFPDAVKNASATGCDVTAPTSGGVYRLFAYVGDKNGGAAVANVMFKVKGDVKIPDARQAELPLVIYSEGESPKAPYTAAGWMGNAKAVKMTLDSRESPHSGESCLKVEYREKDGWAGVVWQSPAGDWGDKAGGWNWSGAKQLSFWARGAEGGEEVSFELGLFGKDKKVPDSGKSKLEKLRLSKEWKQYTLSLEGQDLTRIKSGFAWVLAAPGKPVVFYLDDVKVE